MEAGVFFPVMVRRSRVFTTRLSVGFAAVTDIKDVDQPLGIIDREDDAPVAHTNSPSRWLPLQFLDAMWARYPGQRRDLRGDSHGNTDGELVEFLRRRRLDNDLIIRHEFGA